MCGQVNPLDGWSGNMSSAECWKLGFYTDIPGDEAHTLPMLREEAYGARRVGMEPRQASGRGPLRKALSFGGAQEGRGRQGDLK